jgi:hypothetical protein
MPPVPGGPINVLSLGSWVLVGEVGVSVWSTSLDPRLLDSIVSMPRLCRGVANGFEAVVSAKVTRVPNCRLKSQISCSTVQYVLSDCTPV